MSSKYETKAEQQTMTDLRIVLENKTNNSRTLQTMSERRHRDLRHYLNFKKVSAKKCGFKNRPSCIDLRNYLETKNKSRNQDFDLRTKLNRTIKLTIANREKMFSQDLRNKLRKRCIDY